VGGLDTVAAMKCPVDDTVLQMTDRQGIEIDYCPQCRGVWLDRGELDKLIDRSASASGPTPQRPVSYPPPEQPRYDERYSERHDDRRHDPKYAKKRRKESFLGDLFDF
jgi:Zn-finger nucleic acid-binding protein